jgi:hypothetical protein
LLVVVGAVGLMGLLHQAVAVLVDSKPILSY